MYRYLQTNEDSDENVLKIDENIKQVCVSGKEQVSISPFAVQGLGNVESSNLRYKKLKWYQDNGIGIKELTTNVAIVKIKQTESNIVVQKILGK